MPVYVVTRKADGVEVHRYAAAAVVEGGYPLASFDHGELPDGPPPEAALPASAWWLYPGPFKDRLGMDALALAASSHPACLAAREMLAGRLYVDLKNPRTSMLLDMLIAAGQPEAHPMFPGSGPMTPAKKAAILDTPATEAERYRGQ